MNETRRQTLIRQIEALAFEADLVPPGYRLVMRFERSIMTRPKHPSSTNEDRSSQQRTELLGTPLMEVYRDPNLGVRRQDRTKYSGYIEGVINHPPSNIDGEIVTLGGFAKNLQQLRARLGGEEPCRHLALWFQRLGVAYQQRPTFLYARVDDEALSTEPT